MICMFQNISLLINSSYWMFLFVEKMILFPGKSKSITSNRLSSMILYVSSVLFSHTKERKKPEFLFKAVYIQQSPYSRGSSASIFLFLIYKRQNFTYFVFSWGNWAKMIFIKKFCVFTKKATISRDRSTIAICETKITVN